MIGKIDAIFTDYDGTIAPSNVPREESRVPKPILSTLVDLSSKLFIAVVTSKDYHFIKSRTCAFAKAWACITGLDVRLAASISEERRGYIAKETMESLRRTKSLHVNRSLTRIKAKLPQGVIIEHKRASDRRKTRLGFSIDWTGGPMLTRSEVKSIVKDIEADGLYVTHSPWETYIDAFACKPSKGAAVSILRSLLGFSGRMLYLGDSDADNDAFDKADISIGIDHGQPTETLRCRYLLRSDDLGIFLQALLENDSFYTPSRLLHTPQKGIP